MKCIATVLAGTKFTLVNRGSLALAIFLLCTVALVAQDTPVAPEGTQVATEQTPAAANADELRKEAQNPVASLISVPVQNNNNMGINPGYRTQDVLNIQPVNINVQAYGNAVHPPGASPWGVRATFALLFPKLSKEQQKMLMQQKLKQLEAEQPQKK